MEETMTILGSTASKSFMENFMGAEIWQAVTSEMKGVMSPGMQQEWREQWES
ncbi:unnamed protein product [Strongylus vulgaris]|uniref:Uncharacterized protein n=1 Tax=Strongylus vulgaris TaxID=40348 RepID=A0A3P7ITU5_STRVU|nr:unnamed protein product [Strongylus vulgaris]